MAPEAQLTASGAQAMPLREARIQLRRLVALAELTDTVTVITADGESRPRAALVPAAAARTVAEMHEAQRRADTSAAGWARRVEDAKDTMRRRHEAELHATRRALMEAWQALDALVRPGSEPAIDALRVAHADLLREATG